MPCRWCQGRISGERRGHIANLLCWSCIGIGTCRVEHDDIHFVGGGRWRTWSIADAPTHPVRSYGKAAYGGITQARVGEGARSLSYGPLACCWCDQHVASKGGGQVRRAQLLVGSCIRCCLQVAEYPDGHIGTCSWGTCAVVNCPTEHVRALAQIVHLRCWTVRVDHGTTTAHQGP